MRSSRSLVIASLLLGCSSREVRPIEQPARDPLVQLARFAEFSGHLGRGGALERFEGGFRSKTSAWRRLDGLEVTLANGVTRIARADDADAWIELTALGPAAVASEISGGALVLRGAERSTDLVQVIEPTRFEEYRVLYDASAPSVLRYRVRRGAAIASLRVIDGGVVAASADGRPRLSSAPAFAMDDHGTRRELVARISGETLELALDTEGLAYPIAVDPLWTPTPDLTQPRTQHGAAPLPGGKAFIGGGLRSVGGSLSLTATSSFDPATNTWTALASMNGTTDSFVTTVLSSGKLLVTGGNNSGLPNRGADVYDPATNSWIDAGSHGTPYLADVVAPLSGDRALAVSQPNALLWSLATSTFTAAGTTTVTHNAHTATTLAGDKVLVVGGASTKVADLWDPATKTFGAGGTLSAFRTQHTATLMPSGKVLIVGGTGQSSAELYDPATKTFTAAGAMSTVRTLHTATVLSGERVLVTGGLNGSAEPLSTTEIYDAATNTWKLAAPMSTPRAYHTATALPGPRVLVAFGQNASTALSTAEVFAPAATGASCGSGSECASGSCVDGVCCDTACAGQCEACNVAGAIGTCTVVSGTPRGSRTACEAGGTGVCARTCDGVDRAKCNFAATTVVCAVATCAAGTATSESKCDGAGNCPAPTSTSCAPYACGGTACKSSCGGNADCGGASVCDLATATCVVAVDSRCSLDLLLEVPTDPAKPTKTCAPYACDSTSGKCATRCASTLDCTGGAACDAPSGTCVPAAAPADGGDGGGCGFARSGPTFGVALTLFAVAAASRRRGWFRRR